MIRVRNESSAPLVYGAVVVPAGSPGSTMSIQFDTGGEWGRFADPTPRALCEAVTIDVPGCWVAEKRIVPGEETLLSGLPRAAFKHLRQDARGCSWGVLDEWDVLFIVRDAVRE